MSLPEPNATQRFSGRAGAYSTHRPGYPTQVFDALFDGLGDPRGLVVADVGAGTGISTRLLAARVSRVFAVEPNADMRAKAILEQNVIWFDGTGESTGLDEKSVDVAAAFQAYHWFDHQTAFDEFNRIARKRIALVQYERDEREGFTQAYTRAIRPYMLDDTEGLRLRTLENFASMCGEGLRRAVFPSAQVLTLEGLLGRLTSTSYLPHHGDRAGALRSEVQEVFAQFERDGTVEMAMSVFVLAADVVR